MNIFSYIYSYIASEFLIIFIAIAYIAAHVVIAYMLPFKNTKKVWMSWLLVLAEALVFYIIISIYNLFDQSCRYPPGTPVADICIHTSDALIAILVHVTLFNLVCVTVTSSITLILKKVSKK